MALCPTCRTPIPCHCHLTPPAQIRPGVYVAGSHRRITKEPTMTTDQTARIPYCHKIRYGITGAPILTEYEMDGSHAPGVGVEPTLIELIYNAARGAKPASVSASVTGWWTRYGKRDEPEDQVTTHFKSGPDGWPAWLAEEARLHDPAAVPVPPPPPARAATRGLSVPHRDALWDAVAEAVEQAVYEYRELTCQWDESDGSTQAIARRATAAAREALGQADVSAPPPPPTTRADGISTATLLAIAVHLESRAVSILRPESRTYAEYWAVAALLRRLADEEQPATEAHPPSHTWKVESPRRDQWASWGATYDERVWAAASFEDVVEVAPQRPFRLVRATTTYTVEAEHTPPAPVAQQPAAADTDEERHDA